MTRLPPLFVTPLLFLAFVVAGCVDRGLRTDASPALLASCRARADAVYNTRNREDVFREDIYRTGQRDTPFSGQTVSGSGTGVLSARYAREQFIDRCIAGNRDRLDTPEPLDPRQPIPLKPPAQP